jgi:hypothetical protein
MEQEPGQGNWTNGKTVLFPEIEKGDKFILSFDSVHDGR